MKNRQPNKSLKKNKKGLGKNRSLKGGGFFDWFKKKESVPLGDAAAAPGVIGNIQNKLTSSLNKVEGNIKNVEGNIQNNFQANVNSAKQNIGNFGTGLVNKINPTAADAPADAPATDAPADKKDPATIPPHVGGGKSYKKNKSTKAKKAKKGTKAKKAKKGTKAKKAKKGTKAKKAKKGTKAKKVKKNKTFKKKHVRFSF